jgi:hypothetical protein
MDQPHLHITPGLLRSDNIPSAFPAHLGNPASPSRQLLSRLTAPGALTKLLRQLRNQNRQCCGFRHPTSGLAARYWGWLRDPRTREDFLRPKGISPKSLISSSDEDNARALALAETMINLAKRYDAEFNKRFPQFCHERHKAQTLHKLGQDYDEDAKRHVYMALAHLDAARSTFVRDAVRYAGWCLERDFGGLRAPQLVAELQPCCRAEAKGDRAPGALFVRLDQATSFRISLTPRPP